MKNRDASWRRGCWIQLLGEPEGNPEKSWLEV